MNPATASVRAEILPVANPAMGMTTDERNAAGGERQARSGGVVTQQLLHELRLQNGIRVEHASHQHHQETTYCKILEAEELQVDERILLSPLPDHESDDAADKQDTRRSG